MTDAPDTEPTTSDPVDEKTVETDWKAEAEKLKSEARKWESRSKENAKAAQRLADIEESQKSELEKALDRAEAAEKRASAFEAAQQVSTWKTDVADKAGVPARLLRGSTLEELTAHAEELKEELGNRRGPYVPSPGNVPNHPVTDDAAFARSIFGGRD